MSRRPLFPPVFTAVGSRPLIDDFAMRAARQRAKAQPPGIGSMFVLPARNNSMWSGNNELGRETDFAPDSNNRQLILKLEEWGEPTDWTVTLGISGDYSQLTGTNRFEVTALIEAGVGGTTQKLELDWLNGTSFSMPMNALTVTARYSTSTGFQAPTDLRLSATLGRKSGGRVHDPTRSFSMTINIGESFADLVTIPNFAKNVLVYPIPGPLGRDLPFFYETSRVEFLASTIGSFIVGSFDGSQTITYMEPTTPVYCAPMPLPIPPFARFLRWGTTAAPGLPKFAIAQFGLNL